MTTRGPWFLIALLGLALIPSPLASAAQASQGLGEEIWQGGLDPDELAAVVAYQKQTHNRDVSLDCSGVTLRIYPDGKAALPGTLWCTLTIVRTAPRGVTWEKNTYRLTYTVPPGPVAPNTLKASLVIERAWQYIENNKPASRDFPPSKPIPVRITFTRKGGTNMRFDLPNGYNRIGDVPWRLFGSARPQPTPPPPPPPPPRRQPPNCGSMDLDPRTLPDGLVGVPYGQRIAVTGGTAPYTLEMTAGVAPDGVTLSWVGALAGTPTAAGTYSFMLRGTDLFECVAVRRYTVTIRAADVPPPGPPPPPPRRLPAGPGMGPYHEFAALCRMGWASALAQFSVGPADGTIVEHLQRAGEHMRAANQTTFAPLKAWPNWPSDVGRINSQIDQLNRDGDRFRTSLGLDLRQDAQALINELALQMAGDVVRRPSCDSLYATLGYQMCYTQQAFQIAEAAERQGDRQRQQHAANDGQQLVGSVLRVLSAMPTLPLATGRCVNLGEIALALSSDTISAPLSTRVATHTHAVTRTLDILAAQPQEPMPETAVSSWLAPEGCGAWKR